MNYGIIKVAAAIPTVKVADCAANANEAIAMTQEADRAGAGVIVFPELSITGYTCGDLFFNETLLRNSEQAVATFTQATQSNDIIAIVGVPFAHENAIYNAAVVIHKGKVMGVVPKTYLPNYGEFYEQRWFKSGKDEKPQNITFGGQPTLFGAGLIFKSDICTFGVEICEDLWAPIPPSSEMTLKGAEVVFNLSADNDYPGKYSYLREMIRTFSRRCACGYVFTSCGFGESTTDVVFGGKSIICENGETIGESRRFSLSPTITYSDLFIDNIRHERLTNTTFRTSQKHADAETCVSVDYPEKNAPLERTINQSPFLPSPEDTDSFCAETFTIQAIGLAKRLTHTHCKNVVIGISGGLDSTLALLVCVKAFDMLGIDRKGILSVTMPGFGTTDRTYDNAVALIHSLGTSFKEISIKDACIQHFKDIDHDLQTHDAAYENAQARERTQILMDLANKTNGLVIGTGDLSELALGWATYNGDQMSMYGVNASIPKTLVKFLVEWEAAKAQDKEISRLLTDILDTPISPELIPSQTEGEQIGQKTEELVGPYELHDFFLYHFIKNGSSADKLLFLARHAFHGVYEDDIIKKWLSVFVKRFFTQQFKRSCMPDGPKASPLSLSPRGDWRMPSDAIYESWIHDIN